MTYATTYLICGPAAEPIEGEPRIGAWYCGILVAEDGERLPGLLAQYAGDGEFYDDGCDEPTDMRGYDYLVEQR